MMIIRRFPCLIGRYKKKMPGALLYGVCAGDPDLMDDVEQR